MILQKWQGYVLIAGGVGIPVTQKGNDIFPYSPRQGVEVNEAIGSSRFGCLGNTTPELPGRLRNDFRGLSMRDADYS